MIYLRIGIIMEFLGSISLSTSLIFILVSERTIKRFLKRVENGLRRFLNWLVNILNMRGYKEMRFRQLDADAPIREKIKQNYISLGIMLGIAICGSIALFFALGTYNVVAIICSVPFVIFSGWVFSKAFNNKVLKVITGIFFAAVSFLIYPMLILSALLHISLLSLLLGIISCIVLLHSISAWLARQRVKRVMLISGGLFLVIGEALQFVGTFMMPY